MAWFTANWFWVLIAFAFIAMHMFGHGGHSSHGGGGHQQNRDESEKNEVRNRVVNPSSGGHQH